MTRRIHDIGGLAAGRVVSSGHPSERWGVEITAAFGALMRRKLVRLDEIRRGVEDLGAERYDSLGYFERQTEATAALLAEKGILAREEIERRIADLRRNRKGER